MTKTLIALAFALAAGCGSHFVCKDSADLRLSPDRPFSIKTTCDGDAVFSASGPVEMRFFIVCPAGQDPGYSDGGRVVCVAR